MDVEMDVERSPLFAFYRVKSRPQLASEVHVTVVCTQPPCSQVDFSPFSVLCVATEDESCLRTLSTRPL